MKRPTRGDQRGFTLVELMVSMTLFSFVIAGILAVAGTMARGYRDQRSVIASESAARNSLDFIADAIRSGSPAVARSSTTTVRPTSSPSRSRADRS
jgi:prepilin-type N-terminal cleavage/methylation domain-containing protein